jgi:predicted MFS family arabinose efflux permease
MSKDQSKIEVNTPPPSVSRKQANYALTILFIVFVFNFIDRQILAILLEPIKKDLQVSDTAMGFLTGITFAVFYTFCGLPIARWADKGNRGTIISIGLFIWSLMTALSGMATTFIQLAAARVGVGVGEAAGSPASHSLISDFFPPERRATALSIFNMGASLGLFLGIFLGGWIGQAYGWRIAFLLVGAPGIILALIVKFTLPEPPRGLSEVQDGDDTIYTVKDVFKFLWSLKSFRHLTIAASLFSFATYGLINWTPAFLMRVHEMSMKDAATWYGPLLGISSGAGMLIGGLLCDKLGRKDIRWQLWVCAIAGFGAVPFIMLFLFIPTPLAALICYIPALVFGAFYVGPAYALAQSLSKLRMRAVASAILMFFINLIGLGLGPQVVGIMNDVLASSFGTDSIRYSLTIVGVTNILAGIHFLIASKYLKKDMEAKNR